MMAAIVSYPGMRFIKDSAASFINDSRDEVHQDFAMTAMSDGLSRASGRRNHRWLGGAPSEVSGTAEECVRRAPHRESSA
jgi:hypothetical protein